MIKRIINTANATLESPDDMYEFKSGLMKIAEEEEKRNN